VTIPISPPCPICGAATEGRWVTMDAGNHLGCTAMGYFCTHSLYPVILARHVCIDRSEVPPQT
jgi:hypothetical protein